MYEYKMIKMTREEFRISAEAMIPIFAKQGWRLVQIMQPMILPKLYITLLGLPLLIVHPAWWKLPDEPHFTIVLERPSPAQ